jgi:nicotinate-nucleotide adenylyltransferase
MSTSPRRYALYGGTFDPFHVGHLAVARAALASGRVDEVIVIPGGTPPHRGETRVHAEERWCMAVLATLHEPCMRVVRWETDRADQGRTYAIDTLAQARAALGDDAELFWVIGTDAMALIDTWKDPRALFAQAKFLVMPRDGQDEPWLRAKLGEIVPWAPPEAVAFADMAPVDVSSTELRAALARGEDPAPSLPPLVGAFVARYGLYRGATELVR